MQKVRQVPVAAQRASCEPDVTLVFRPAATKQLFSSQGTAPLVERLSTLLSGTTIASSLAYWDLVGWYYSGPFYVSYPSLSPPFHFVCLFLSSTL